MFSLALAFVFACCTRVRGATQAVGLEGMEPVPPPVRLRPKRGNNRPGDAGLDSNGRGRVSARGARRKERSSGYLGEERGNSRSGAGYRGQSREERSNGSGRGRAGGPGNVISVLFVWDTFFLWVSGMIVWTVCAPLVTITRRNFIKATVSRLRVGKYDIASWAALDMRHRQPKRAARSKRIRHSDIVST